MSTRRRGANTTATASSGGSGKKRARSKLNINLSSHGGQYEDLDDDDDNNTPTLHDEELDSDDNADDDLDNDMEDDEEDSEEDEETVDAKRLRLARNYLTKMKAQQSSSSSDEEDDDSDNSDDDTNEEDKLGKRIAKERLKKSGLLQLQIATSIQSSIQTLRSSIAKDIGIDAASQAWLGGGTTSTSNTNTQQQQQDEIYSKNWLNHKYITYHRGHDLSPTSVALSSNGHVAYSGSKDGSLLMWNVVNGGRKLNTILPVVKGGNSEGNNSDRNTREILSIATSDDDRYLAVGGRDNCVRIFDIRTLGKNTNTTNGTTPITTLSGHKKAVTSLSFRSRTLDLYSGSEDRCIRRYDLNALTYVETLYGHQSSIIDIDCALKNRPVSIAQDRTVRLWKVEEDSHLVYRPGGDVSSAECVCAIQDGWFITGHDDGRLALWKEEKKRPVGEVVVAAHGYANGNRGVSRSVMCCDGLKLSDVLATGSNDGYLRLWKVNTSGDKNEAGISPLESVPIHGHINSIAMGPEGKFCVAAVGQEPRLGRWDRVPRAKNRFAIIKLNADGEE